MNGLLDHARLFSEFKKKVKMDDDQHLSPGGLVMFIDTHDNNPGNTKKFT